MNGRGRGVAPTNTPIVGATWQIAQLLKTFVVNYQVLLTFQMLLANAV
jgi:hypothetical protein